MDLGFLDKSSHVTPLLVRLYDSHKIYTLAHDKKPEARQALTKAVLELLEMDLSPREGELIADVLIALIRQAERDLRQALAERLAAMDNVPLRLVLHMANDEIDVARPVLRESCVLGDLDLIYIIRSKGAEYWCEIARRQAMTDQVMELLARTRDFNTALALAENDHIKLTPAAQLVLSDLAQNQDTLARPLLRRDEITPDIAQKLYAYVGAELKSLIAERFGAEGAVVGPVVDEIVMEFSEPKGDDSLQPHSTALRSAERFKEKGLLTTKMMLGTLKRGQIQSFVAQFAVFTDLSPDLTAQILMQESGQALAIACKAYEIPKADFVSIFLLTNRIRHPGRMVDVKDMTRAIAYYDRIKTDIARHLLKNATQDIFADKEHV